MKQSAMPEGDWSYDRAGPGDLEEVARLWLGEMPSSTERELLKQTLRTDAENDSSWWLARRAGQPEAIMLVLRQPGTLATCWPPRATIEFSPAEIASIGKRLWAVTGTALRQAGVRLFQAVAPDTRSLDGHLLRALGFQPATRLLTLRWRPQHGGKLRPGETSVTFFPVDANEEVEFSDLLKKTFVDSLDTPELEQFQSPEEILAAQGLQYAQRWIARKPNGRSVGALVLSQDKTLGQLNYCGVVPESRRQRVGTDMVLWALQHLRLHHVRRVHVRLDARNVPAKKLYEGCGFQSHSVEELYLSE